MIQANLTEVKSTRSRDREKTAGRIVEAARALIVQSGFSHLGINQIALQAGVDKVLIYRYFGGFEGLLQTIAESEDFFPAQVALHPPESWAGRSLIDTVTAMASQYLEELSRRPLALQLYRWELVEENPLITAFRASRRRYEEACERTFEGCGPGQSRLGVGLFKLVASGILHRRLAEGQSLLENDDAFLAPIRYLADTMARPGSVSSEPQAQTDDEWEEEDPNSLPTNLL